MFIDEAPCNWFEFYITGHLGVHEDACELPGRHDELRNQINRIVTVPAELGWRVLIGFKLAIELGWAMVSRSTKI